MKNTKKLVLAAFFLALGLVLPFFTGQIRDIGNKLLPMHIPILLCGFICGPKYGLLVGFLTPLLRFSLFSMPQMPNAITMAFELATYGVVTGLLYQKLAKSKFRIYICLLTSMVVGRIIWGISCVIVYGISHIPFNWQLFIGGALINAIPGIIIQLILIPILILTLEKSGVLQNADC